MTPYYRIRVHNILVVVKTKEEYDTRKDFYKKLVEDTCNKALNYTG